MTLGSSVSRSGSSSGSVVSRKSRVAGSSSSSKVTRTGQTKIRQSKLLDGEGLNFFGNQKRLFVERRQAKKKALEERKAQRLERRTLLQEQKLRKTKGKGHLYKMNVASADDGTGFEADASSEESVFDKEVLKGRTGLRKSDLSSLEIDYDSDDSNQEATRVKESNVRRLQRAQRVDKKQATKVKRRVRIEDVAEVQEIKEMHRARRMMLLNIINSLYKIKELKKSLDGVDKRNSPKKKAILREAKALFSPEFLEVITGGLDSDITGDRLESELIDGSVPQLDELILMVTYECNKQDADFDSREDVEESVVKIDVCDRQLDGMIEALEDMHDRILSVKPGILARIFKSIFSRS